jgi:hypothetical protein
MAQIKQANALLVSRMSNIIKEKRPKSLFLKEVAAVQQSNTKRAGSTKHTPRNLNSFHESRYFKETQKKILQENQRLL